MERSLDRNRPSSDPLTSAQSTNRMDSKTKWFVIGLLFFGFGCIILAGYFFTPGYDPGDHNRALNSGLYSFSDKQNAWPFAVFLLVFGFLVLLVNSCCNHCCE